MDWARLLSPLRPGTTEPLESQPARTAFERDYDRILFSNAFRRLHDKTQVFPMPANDHIHSRLTHSLEVASVGRTLGRWCGQTVVARHGLDREEEGGLHARDIGDIVASACLAHDIGNPPFGHSGEDAIGRWFRRTFERLEAGTPERAPQRTRASSDPLAGLASLTPAEREDLCHFEGNAQGFRVVTRLAMYPDRGGLRLTCPTLGAFSKYPCSVTHSGTRKKYGVFQADLDAFRAVAATLGLVAKEVGGDGASWARHPLAYLLEAADDICYSILDLEDGFTLKKLAFRDVQDLLGAVARTTSDPERGSERDQVAFLRARSIQNLIAEVVTVFCDCEPELLAGTFGGTLIDKLPSAQLIQQTKKLASQHCYRAPDVVAILMSGYEVIGRLLDEILPAVLTPAAEREPRESRLMALLPAAVETADGVYARTLAVTDYISGMTDRYAMNLYRQIFGATAGR
jgi:dGTPase